MAGVIIQTFVSGSPKHRFGDPDLPRLHNQYRALGSFQDFPLIVKQQSWLFGQGMERPSDFRIKLFNRDAAVPRTRIQILNSSSELNKISFGSVDDRSDTISSCQIWSTPSNSEFPL